jgi:aspartyl protease family protein
MNRIALAAAAIVFGSILMVPSPDTLNTVTTAKNRSAKQRSHHSGGDVVLPRRRGHFYAEAEINGTSIMMMADTGASVVALSVEDAEAAGISVDSLNFTYSVSTANGDAEAAPVTLDEITVGPITRYNVRAVVTRNLSGSLLGMSFFNTLSKVAIESNEMVLED